MKFWKQVTTTVFDHEAFTKERERLGLSSRQVAIAADVSAPFLCDLEKGKRTVSDETAGRLIAALGKLKAAKR